MDRRGWMVLVATGWSLAHAAPKSKDYRVGERLPDAAMSGKSAGNYRDIGWEALVPQHWDAMTAFRDNMAQLNDADPRAIAALDKLRKEWDKAPVEPAMNGKRVRISGFVVPLDGDDGNVREYLLAPYFGACIHLPPPPANQIIHVFADKPSSNVYMMAAVSISGVLQTVSSPASGQAMGLAGSMGYRMRVEQVAAFKRP
ncbi:DUF3299 domain-containing protein [Actimicrobium sp. CCC2.4]|uniref:DUF3299 domain-containing protein n=1 Tax=Actimicrobium sp. CCC2.4 TaxID=3048606 RepID=UPI002AC99148|nr:DUF3299 domain-containing protein [Actimicrobium sp. CCC2.4]MEB0134660.1 DUF3299 domain-containing protein [Actimicrobium sp. CCC2.4]WPX30603.1 DUF3299 domain-containing protein [Actimicrobium sp. CCC2.4]